MDATLFDLAAERLEHHTGFDRLEARGTLRIALKVAGLDPSAFTVEQLCVVFEKVMPGELENRGVSDAAVTCSTVIDDLAVACSTVIDDPANTQALPDMASSTPLDEIFGRLADG